jgi:murein DD-endopeptidase MepM/ murein hydrolase activator NlpD
VVSEPKLSNPWLWVMAKDYGVRNDEAGQGGFLTPRYHGSHNGLDMLAPIGEKVLAPCSGKARTGASGSFGIWVQLICPLPKELRQSEGQRASIFFSHLRRASFEGDDVKHIARGEVLGGVGKTGNAAGPSVASHLHLELIFHDDEKSALAETHSGRSQADTSAAHSVRKLLESRCLAPNAFQRREGEAWRNRRADPFLVLSCFSDRKPSYEKPKGTLAAASTPWSEYYSATGFDVDVGRQVVETETLASAQ